MTPDFEGMIKYIFKEIKGIDYTDKLERMTWANAMMNYGNDKTLGDKFISETVNIELDLQAKKQ